MIGRLVISWIIKRPCNWNSIHILGLIRLKKSLNILNMNNQHQKIYKFHSKLLNPTPCSLPGKITTNHLTLTRAAEPVTNDQVIAAAGLVKILRNVLPKMNNCRWAMIIGWFFSCTWWPIWIRWILNSYCGFVLWYQTICLHFYVE